MVFCEKLLEEKEGREKLKILAIHLPAFHQIKENDEWWGKGFTEWDNVRSGKRYFKGHIQPVKPLDHYYYDLSKKEDIEHQIDLANEYGVDGFIFYHYWFGNDQMLFTKPVEILKNEIDKKIEYCFCWANESWITTWHGKDPKQLMPMVYEGEKDWQKHMDYFLPYFKDERYIKIENKPVLFIYKPNEIPNYDEMLDFWNAFLKKKGFEGIYVVEYISSKNRDLYSQKSNAVTEFEPLYTTFFDISFFQKLKRLYCKKFQQIDYQDYQTLWEKNICRTRTYQGKPIIRGCFCGWDNSPRKEKKSMIVKNGTPQNFEKNLKRLIKNKRKDASLDYLVINAWNEWSEGAMLEPSEHFHYGYLEAIQNVKKDLEK